MHSALDQAAGLRRLLGAGGLRVVPVTAGRAGSGRTMFVINFATAAARLGLKVLLLDQTAGEIATALGLAARHELRHVLSGEKGMAQVALPGPAGLYVVPAMRGLEALLKTPNTGTVLSELCAEICDPLDLVVVNTPAERAASACALAARADSGREVVVLAADSPSTITATYAQIKTLAREYGQQHFRVLFNRAASESEARRLYHNMASTVRKNCAAMVRYGGSIPRDASLQRAHRAKLSIFASAPQARSAHAFQQLAAAFTEWQLPEFSRASARQSVH